MTENLRSEFKFNNPNAAAKCGCGESFKTKVRQYQSVHLWDLDLDRVFNHFLLCCDMDNGVQYIISAILHNCHNPFSPTATNSRPYRSFLSPKSLPTIQSNYLSEVQLFRYWIKRADFSVNTEGYHMQLSKKSGAVLAAAFPPYFHASRCFPRTTGS